jgi:hypothetical protein
MKRSFPLLQERVALLGEAVEFGLLVGEPVSVARLVAGARLCGRLLDHLPDIVAHNGDAVLELIHRKRRAVAHERLPGCGDGSAD